jgi:hypothetical protein
VARNCRAPDPALPYATIASPKSVQRDDPRMAFESDAQIHFGVAADCVEMQQARPDGTEQAERPMR